MIKKLNTVKLPNKSENKAIIQTEKSQPTNIKQADTPTKNETLINRIANESRKCPIQIYHEKDEDNNKTIATKNAKNETDIFQQLTGTPNELLAQNIIHHGVNALAGGWDNTDNVNTILQTLADLRPNNVNESRLVVQGAVLYSKAMNYFRMAEHSLDNLEDLNPFAKTASIENHKTQTKYALKLLQMHNETIECLNRLRRVNEQKIVVQHINVSNSAKAIVGGQMIAGSGGEQKKSGEVSS